MICEEAPAKLNLALHITRRRDNGYHDLDSLVAFASLGDTVLIDKAQTLSLKIDGPFAANLADQPDNSLFAAWRALQDYASKTSQLFAPVAFVLNKRLPVASGIGGGSSDAAAALRGLCRLFELKISHEELHHLALSLGADVPVCLKPGCYRMRGIGEHLQPLDLAIPPYLVMVNPLKPLATAKVFQSLNLKTGEAHRHEITELANPQAWRNDLLDAAQRLEPEITQILLALKEAPALKAPRLSGSGATCFAFAETKQQVETAARHITSRHPNWWVTSSCFIK